jgi:hypothetical protein
MNTRLTCDGVVVVRALTLCQLLQACVAKCLDRFLEANNLVARAYAGRMTKDLQGAGH